MSTETKDPKPRAVPVDSVKTYIDKLNFEDQIHLFTWLKSSLAQQVADREKQAELFKTAIA